MTDQSNDANPTPEEFEELMLSCRYGDQEDVDAFVAKYGWSFVDKAQDESGNTVLHMISGNGHLDLLNYILPHLSPDLLSTANKYGLSTPLHWAAMNGHLPIAKSLVLFPGGPGSVLIDQRNAAGRSPLGEAELAGADEVANWFVEVMLVTDPEPVSAQDSETAEEPTDETDVTSGVETLKLS